jgi:hypothetical protein
MHVLNAYAERRSTFHVGKLGACGAVEPWVFSMDYSFDEDQDSSHEKNKNGKRLIEKSSPNFRLESMKE